MYVVESVAVEVKEEQTIREFGLALYERRAKGSSQVNSSRCEITTSRPMYVVVQDTEPKVSTRRLDLPAWLSSWDCYALAAAMLGMFVEV